ncbi:hypothetical protein D3C78_308590 [compost metagenome]
MQLATPLNHYIVTLTSILEPVAASPNWKEDCLVWMAVAGTFIAARQGEDVRSAYPITTRKMIGIIGEDLFKAVTVNPAHPVLFENRDRRLVAEKVFGQLVAEAHEIVLASEGEWYESNILGTQVRDIMASMYYAVRYIATYQDYSFEAGMQAARSYAH